MGRIVAPTDRCIDSSNRGIDNAIPRISRAIRVEIEHLLLTIGRHTGIDTGRGCERSHVDFIDCGVDGAVLSEHNRGCLLHQDMIRPVLRIVRRRNAIRLHPKQEAPIDPIRETVACIERPVSECRIG